MLPLAHPVLAPRGVAAPPVLVALIVFCIVVLSSRIGARRGAGDDPPSQPDDPVLAPLFATTTPAGWVLRAIGLGVLSLGIAAGAWGTEDQLENIAPALLVGFGWPALLVLEVAVGGVFARVNPWDTLARLTEKLGAGVGAPSEHVRPAAVAALAWVWYLTVPRNALEPTVVAAAFGGYTVITLAGCLAFGRVTWLTRGEVFTILFGWVTRARLGRLATWEAPTGGRALIAVLAGGLLAGQLRDTHLYDPLRTRTYEWGWHSVALLVVAGVVYLVLRAADRAREGAGRAGVATAAAVWSVVGLALALALARNRVLTSAQFLPSMASDPFGFGWDVFGTSGAVRFRASPLTEAGRVWAQVSLVTVSAVAASRVVVRRYPDDLGRRTTPTTAIGLLAWVGVLAFMAI